MNQFLKKISPETVKSANGFDDSQRFSKSLKSENQDQTAIKVKTIMVKLDIPLSPHQIPHFRGAILEKADRSKDIMHNHKGDEDYHYRYPLVHYRVQKGKATLYGLGAGAEAIRYFLLTVDDIRRANTEIPLCIDHLTEKSEKIQWVTHGVLYRIFDCIPFTPKNYQLWQSAPNLIARIELLQKVLTNHLVSFTKAMGYQLPDHLDLDVMTIRSMRTVYLHDTPMLAFNMIFKTNIVLPMSMAMGRGISHGYGVMQRLD